MPFQLCLNGSSLEHFPCTIDRLTSVVRPWVLAVAFASMGIERNLVDPASSHMLVSKIKPCMSRYKLLYGKTVNGSLKQLQFI